MTEQTTSMCDCERGHNGLGIATRECDCDEREGIPGMAMRDTRESNRQKIPPLGAGMIRCPVCEGKGQIASEAVSIGMRIMIARKAMGLTQADLAPKLGIGRAQLANIEGDRSLPSVEVLLRISNTLEVSADHLLGRH